MYGKLRPGRTPGNPRQPTGCLPAPERERQRERRVGAVLAARAARLRAALKTYRKFAQSRGRALLGVCEPRAEVRLHSGPLRVDDAEVDAVAVVTRTQEPVVSPN